LWHRRRVRPILRDPASLPKDSVVYQRQDMYLANHYTTLHVTVVGLALGVAGVVASSLLAGTPSPNFDAYQSALYVLWLASLLGIAVAYGGPMIANILMPARIPAVVDLVLPLLLGVCEFMQFTILGYRLTGWTSPRAVLAGWWFTFGAFGLVASLGTWRAYYLIDRANKSAVGVVASCAKRLRSNIFGAAATAVLGGLIGIYYLLLVRSRTEVNTVLAIAAVAALLFALDTYRRMANELRIALSSTS